MKNWVILALLLNLAGTIMLVLGLRFKKEETGILTIEKNSLVSVMGIVLLIVACFLQIFVVFKS